MIYSFLQNGDSAVTVQFQNEISKEVNSQVTALCDRLEAKRIDGVIELVPTFASLTVFYDCSVISSKKLKKKIESLNCHVLLVMSISMANLIVRLLKLLKTLLIRLVDLKSFLNGDLSNGRKG